MRDIHCPKCQSTNLRCYNEHTEWFRDVEGNLYEAPVGDMVCLDCGVPFSHDDQIDAAERVTYDGGDLL